MAKKKKTSDRQQILLDTLRDHPDADTRTLARLLAEQFPHEFTSVENARASLRYLRGAKGASARERAKPLGAVEDLRTPRTLVFPKGIKQCIPNRRFSDKGKWLLIGDLHAPYHNETALEEAVKVAKDQGCEHLCINGDFLDFYKMSRWSQDPRFRNPDKEIKTGREILGILSETFPGRKVFKMGNHEERYEKYLFEKAPAVIGIEDFELDRVLRLKDHGFDFVRGKQLYSLGKMHVFHGHELPRGLTDPVNVARGIYLRVRESSIANHWHRTSTHVDSSGLKARTTTCYSNGCLCDLSPEYARVNSWNLGFALVQIGEGGSWSVQNRVIDRGRSYITE